MVPSLSEGVIERILQDPDNLPQNPVLQILGIKKINANQSSGNDRYRLVLSDGIHLHTSAMLGTQLNDKILNKEIEVKAVVRLDKYVCNTVQETRKVLIILGITVLESGQNISGKIGDPKQYTSGTSSSKPQNNAISSSKPSMGQGDVNQNQSSKKFNPPPSRPQQFQNNNSATSPGMQKGGFGQRGGNSAFGSNQPINRGGQTTGKSVYPISSLTPYQNRWTVRVRVSSKSNIRTWSNSRGEGKLFSVDLMDESGEIKATGFNEAVDRFYDLLKINKVFYISKASLKSANKQYTSIKNDYEMYLNNDTLIEECTDDVQDLPETHYNFTSIGELENVQKDAIVDIMGIVTSYADVTQITTRATNRQLSKRDLVLMDRSEKTVNCTLWGADAESFEDKGQDNPVVVIKGAKVSDFGGRSLSLPGSSTLLINPDFVKEAFQLKGWYDSVGKNRESVSISGQRMDGGSYNAKFKTLSQIKDEQLGMGEKPDYVSVKSSCVFFKKDNALYKACPKEDCNKKVIEDGDSYRCEKCNRTYPNFQHRMILQVNLSDCTGNQWVTCFQESAETLLNIKANELGDLSQDDPRYEAVFSASTFKTYVMKLRAKMETYNDEARLKCSVVNVQPLDFKQESRRMLEEIRHLQSTM